MALWKRLRTALLVLAALLVLVVIATLRGGDDPPRVRFTEWKPPAGTQQVVVVEAPNTGGSRATVSLYEPDQGDVWVRVKGPYAAWIGASGFIDPGQRTEGDATTPLGVFPLPSAFGGAEPPEGTDLPYTVIKERGHCWISDPNSQAYNRWVFADPCVPPNVDLYDATRPGQRFHLAIVIGFNVELRRANAGSALFLQATGDALLQQGTDGGVSLDRGQLSEVLAWLEPAKNPVVIMGPAAKVSSPAEATE